MPKKSFWNIGKANAEITAADSAIDPALANAKITTLKVDGRDVPAHEAPLASKISALLSVAAPGVAAQDISELVVTNDQLSKQIEKVSDENTQLAAGNAALTQENVQTKADLVTAKASIESLTASQSELSVRHEAALNQVSASTTKFNALNTKISQACITAGCLELPKDADTDEKKLEAANAIKPEDKLTAYEGAVNAAVARIGDGNGKVPNGNGKVISLSANNVIAKYEAITDSTEKIRHYRANKQAIDAAYREKL